MFKLPNIIKKALIFVLVLLAIIYSCLYINTHKFDRHNETQLAKLKTINPNAYLIFSRFINDIHTHTPYIVYIQSTLRSYKEQEKLHNDDPFNAKPGTSKHNKGLAIDFNVKYKYCLNGGWLKKADYLQWKQSGVITIAQKYGLFWGGNFKTKKDCVHFEIR